MSKTVYLIGSLRNPEIPLLGNRLRTLGVEVFDNLFSAGKIADDSWQEYSNIRGHTYEEALNSYEAKHVFEFDLHHLNRSSVGVLAMPAGKSGHIEFGYLVGQGKPGFVLFDAVPERYDVMYQFAYLNGGSVCFSEEALLAAMKKVL